VRLEGGARFEAPPEGEPVERQHPAGNLGPP
jgi:hypothetical protein